MTMKKDLPSMPTGTLMAGKRGLVMGVANDHSIAWGIAKALHAQGASLALSWQGEAIEKRVIPLAESIQADIVAPCDVSDDDAIAALFKTIKDKWGGLDFVVHAIAWSDRKELNGRVMDVSRGNFTKSMDVSCYSLMAVTRYAEPLMTNGGSVLTLTFAGAERVVRGYNLMGVAKAALEAAVKYMADELGRGGIRINALSAGPVRTLAGNAVAGARHIYRYQQHHAPLRFNPNIVTVGASAVYLLSDLAKGVSGEVHHVDGGYNILGLPDSDSLSDFMHGS